MTLMLLVAHFLALGVAVMVFFWMLLLQRRKRAAGTLYDSGTHSFPLSVAGAVRPASWLAIRTTDPAAVRAVLAVPDEFFISPQVNGWVIVTGPGLPSPGDDVDGCFRFLASASRKLGHLQFFHMEKFSGRHAWARLDNGRVTRAYAWAGETIWNQGEPTAAERGLDMNCHAYGEDPGAEPWTTNEPAAANIEKIPQLAARWSLDPGMLHRAGDDVTNQPGYN
jgi:hypothetical protein